MGERSGKWGNVPGELVRGKCERIRGNLELSGKAEATQGGTLGAAWLIYRVPMHFKRSCYEELRTSCATDLRAVIRRHVAIVGPTKKAPIAAHTNLDGVASSDGGKYCRPHARPFRLGLTRVVTVLPVRPPAAL